MKAHWCDLPDEPYTEAQRHAERMSELRFAWRIGSRMFVATFLILWPVLYVLFKIILK